MKANSKYLDALIKLGIHLSNFNPEKEHFASLQEKVKLAKMNNGWFTQESIEITFLNWGKALSKENINKWLAPYNFKTISSSKTVALILAGNIPLVGFHDLICVWLSGHQALVKCASKDLYLLPYMTAFLENEVNEKKFTYTDQKLENFDAVIATGSNNAARYFDHYFSEYPNIIRKNRNGVAVLDGTESEEELIGLGNDMLQYYGLGCRNVSKLYLPRGFDLNLIFGGLYPFADVINHAKYGNNYDYNKAVWLMSEFDFLENGFFMLKEDTGFSAPISCAYYSYYDTFLEVMDEIENQKEAIQCIISKLDIKNSIPPGEAQQPNLWDYADGIDTLEFLNNL